MRISAEIIKREGERLSIHSKFYIWNDMLFEPSLYRGKPTKSYKPVTDSYRVRRALERVKTATIPTVSSVSPSFKVPIKEGGSFKHDRYAILDIMQS